jgi:membrane dipeptidase
MTCTRTRREFIAGSAALVAGAVSAPLFASASPMPKGISVDVHSHAFLSEEELDRFKSGIGPDVSLISGHPSLGPLARVFEAIEARKIPIARTPADIYSAKEQGKRVAMIATEGGYILDGNLGKLEEFNARGLVSLQLLRKPSNDLIDADDGLTTFGKEVIRAQNRLGMIVDLAHSKARTIIETARVSTKPIMLSHYNTPVKDAWKAVADSGGIIGNWWGPAQAKRGLTFDTWISWFSVIADAVGIDAVAVQTEMGSIIHRGPFNSYADWGMIGKALMKSGFNSEESQKILGGNFMRMFGIITTNKG